jgi:predicted exporter
LVVIPLVVGTAAGMSFAVGVFGNLNILTGFLGAILMGLGVDYGIHLISRYLDVRRSTGLGPAESWVQGFATAGRASIYAGLTTMIALGSLAVSTFRAFYEFGVIAMGGIVLILLSYALLLPVMLFVIPERFLRPSLASVVGGFLDRRLRGFAPEERGMHLKVMVVAGSVAVLSALGMGLAGGPSLAFDRTFASLAMTEGEAWRLDEMVNDVLGESQTPAVVMVEDATHRAAVIAELKRRQGLEGGVAIGGVLSIDDVVPTDQARKLEILEGLKSRIDGVPAAARSQELVDFMEEIERTVAHGPITRDNLPGSLSKPFSRTDSADAGIVLVLPGVDLNTAEGSELFTRMVRGLPGAHGGEVDAIADSMLLVDIMGFVVADTEWMVGLTFVGVLGVALFAFGWRRETLLVVVFLTVSIVSALGTVALMGQTYNFINVLVFPIWLGLGVDASFHLLIHLRAHPEKFGDLVSTTVSVMAAFLTSIIGFAALTLSHHQGLNSLGWVASIGLVMILAVNAAIAGVLGATAQRRLL